MPDLPELLRTKAMSHYKNATSCTYFLGKEAAESSVCEVRITEKGEIVVSYETDDGYTVYKGQELGKGHYLLESDEPFGRGSLHRFEGSQILEGYWEEDGSKGMWRIELSEISDDVTGDAADDDEPVSDSGSGNTENAVAVGELEISTSIDSHDSESFEWETIPKFYRFPLRHDWTVQLRLPDDLTRREGKRLARFVKSLSCY